MESPIFRATSPTGLHKHDADFTVRRSASRASLTEGVPRTWVGEYEQDEEQQTIEASKEKLWALMGTYLASDHHSIQRSIVNHIEYTLACTRFNFDDKALYLASAHSIRDRLIESWNDTQQFLTERDVKRVYYLSLEFLMGRAMQNALVNLDIEDNFKNAIRDLGFDLEEIYGQEHDAALGNGGLGRLAACFLDSMATLDYPAWGYGIRYNYGIFEQRIVNGYQVEHPDYWLTFGNPWEIERKDVTYPVRFYGQVRRYRDEKGRERSKWEGGEIIQAVAYDTPIPGFDTFNTINLRLWRATPAKEFDFQSFNEGDYLKAVEARQRAEYISSVLYPNDSTYSGKELRLKQQYFFVCATIQDVMRRFHKRPREINEFAQKVAIQLNDTHPSIAIAELLRKLMDEEGMDWEEAWGITTRVFGYTNHTVLPEALEKWSVDLLANLLPRHLEIIYLINHHFLQEVAKRWPNDGSRMMSMSLIEETQPKMVRMANLAIVGSHAINGVAELHTELVKTTIFKDFYEMWPARFQNKTNGVTPRRWLYVANPRLSNIISHWLGSDEWVKDLSLLSGLKPHVDNAELQHEWMAVKRHNKERLAAWVLKHCNIRVSPDALFDVMVKRMHEYKRQLLNALSVIHRYDTIKHLNPEQKAKVVPRVVLIGGKAAPGYVMAKRVIKLVNNIADRVNNDPDIGDLLKVVFLPNYNVSNAEIIIPAADLNQHISTAGTEASGTSNMKFAMNGGLIIGTMDGANVEIAKEAGEENLFIFGARAHEVDSLRNKMRVGGDKYTGNRLKQIFAMMTSGQFGDPKEMREIVDSLSNGRDHYLVCHDFYAYIEAQDRVDAEFPNKTLWAKKSITVTANMGKFSSDRTIHEYAQQIWDAQPCPRPNPHLTNMTRVRSFANFDPNKMKEQTDASGAARIEAPAVTGDDAAPTGGEAAGGKRNKKKNNRP
eukprot:GILJ01004142.1.p1 GENE.GILJ01004142.1~~GILJ01004142.1.p1  ORF type:complete len:944 (-),score=189.07 GILJ01004142.1:272-3103(-)